MNLSKHKEMSKANTLLREQSFKVKLLFLQIINAKEQVSDQKYNRTQRKPGSYVIHHQGLRLAGLVLICADLA